MLKWPARIAVITAMWSVVYAAVALAWVVTGTGFPLGENDPQQQFSFFRGMPAAVGAPAFAIIATLAAAFAAVLAVRLSDPHRTLPPMPLRAATLVGAGLLAFVLLLVLPDIRLMGAAGYFPKLILSAPFDPSAREALSEMQTPQMAHHLASVFGGMLWGWLTVGYWRNSSQVHDRARARAWALSPAGQRSAKIWVAIAFTVPALYAIQRILWSFGVPLGIAEGLLPTTEPVLEQAAFWLGMAALGCGILSLGLVQEWGQVFPRWIPVLGGRRVPTLLAVIPASIAAVIIMSASVGSFRLAFESGLVHRNADGWAMIAPMLAWPLWSIALAVATVLYYQRRKVTDSLRHLLRQG
jgi:hypothetical protein